MDGLRNGLFDDLWLALYESSDGDPRIADEAVDDALRAGAASPASHRDRIDKDEHWFGTAIRTRADPSILQRKFLSDIAERERAVPSSDDLPETWSGRAYTDGA